MKRFFKVELGTDGWGLLANEGSAEEPKFQVVLKNCSEARMERMASDLNSSRNATSTGGTRAGTVPGYMKLHRHD